jgi:uncharacterized protein YbcI
MTANSRLENGALALAVSNAVVRALARTTGRGPTKAKATLGENAIFVVLQDTMTRGERSLAAAGQRETVIEMRRGWQRVIQDEVSAEVEELTGRRVVGFLTDSHIDPDVAVNVFVLEPPEEPAGDQAAERTSRAGTAKAHGQGKRPREMSGPGVEPPRRRAGPGDGS